MADLPELADSTKRKLVLQWRIHLETNGLTGDHVNWHKEERDRLQRIAAQGGSRSCAPRRGEPETDEVGIYSTVKVTEERFNDVTREYWRLWLSSGEGCECFDGWLEVLKRQVAAQIASIFAVVAERNPPAGPRIEVHNANLKYFEIPREFS